MPNHADHLRRQAVLGLIDEKTKLPAWAVDDSEVVKRAGIAALDLYEEMAKLEDAVARTQGDGELTERGKTNRLAQIATAFVSVDVATAEGHRDRLAREAQTARAALTVPPPEGDKIVVALRADEIRRRLKELDQLEADVAALEAAQRGDAETLHALLEAPGWPLVTEEGRRRATEAFFAASRSDEMARADRLESALRQLNGLIDKARRRAGQLGAKNAARPPKSNTAAA